MDTSELLRTLLNVFLLASTLALPFLSAHEPVYSASTSCPTLTASTYTPIVIPLHGDNYPDGTFTDLEGGVMFNFTGRGAVQMSWIAKDAPYGFLVMPARGANGQITTGRAMFGTLTVQPAPPYDPDPTHTFISNGFNALSIFDIPLDDNMHQYYTNGKRYSGTRKGYITPDNDVWQDLRVWEDTCHCGDSRYGHLWTLSELGITRISLDYVQTNKKDKNGNALMFKGSMVQNAVPVNIYDVVLQTR